MTCLVHLIMGGREIAARLLAADLHVVVKHTMYFCWHIVTIAIAGLAIGFAVAATGRSNQDLAWFMAIGSGLFCILNIALIIKFGLNWRHHPQWLLFLPGFVFGLAGLLA